MMPIEAKFQSYVAFVARSRLQIPPDHATDMTLRAIRPRTSVRKSYLHVKHALICICQFSVFRYNGFRYLYNKKFKQLFVYANQWKAYSLSACSVFVSLTDLWTTTIIDIISS